MNLPRDNYTELEFFIAFSKALSSTLDQGKLLDIIIEAAKTLTQAEASSLLLLDETSQCLHFAHATGQVSDELMKLSVPMGQGIAGWVARERQPQIVNQADKDERWYPGIDRKTKFTTRSILCVPLLVGQKTVGVIEVINKLGGGVFDTQDQELLQKIADMAGQVLDNAGRFQKLRDENLLLRDEISGRYSIIGQSPSVREVLALAQKVASGATTVLLQGENGTGKELLARFIHGQSPRADKPFIAVNLAAVPLQLMESELFGHEKGAFTGAAARRKGRFELAHQGTIFLDEVGDLPPPVQAKILRVLQEREFERLGGTETIRVDVRIVAATNQDLQKLVREGNFREDLYYRLNVFQIFLPPLRQRPGDIPILADHFLERYRRETKKVVSGFSPQALKALEEYSWPGNIRELQNVVERAVVLASSSTVELEHLPALNAVQLDGQPLSPIHSWEEAQRRFRRDYLIRALEANSWNQRRTAAALQMQPTYLSRLLRELGVERKAT